MAEIAQQYIRAAAPVVPPVLHCQKGKAMRGPKPPDVALSAEERQGLDTLVRAHATGQQLVLRARVADRLTDAPRAGRTPQLTPEQTCRIVALACEAPSQSGRPISQWTSREVADEVVRRGIVEAISPRHAARLLQRGICSPTASATG